MALLLVGLAEWPAGIYSLPITFATYFEPPKGENVVVTVNSSSNYTAYLHTAL